MPCLYPLSGYKTAAGGWTPNKQRSPRGEPLTVPCGQCLGCRLTYSRHWAIRCLHEAQMHRDNIFLTLTYAPEHLPAGRSLDKKAVPQFMADLRSELGHPAIKYFHCGEYGTDLHRPHYHVLIFGFRPSDERSCPSQKGSYPLYVSSMLERLWPWGFCPYGELNFETAAYTARYATKKITGKKAASHYERVDPETGEIFNLQPEYATMSNRGGIGRSWLEKYFSEVYPSDTVLVNGRLVRPPRFYDKICKELNPDIFQAVRKERLKKLEEKDVMTLDQLADLRRDYQTKFDLQMRSIE